MVTYLSLVIICPIGDELSPLLQEIFDYHAKLARTDLVPPAKSDLERRFGPRPVTIIADFNTGTLVFSNLDMN